MHVCDSQRRILENSGTLKKSINSRLALKDFWTPVSGSAYNIRMITINLLKVHLLDWDEDTRRFLTAVAIIM